MRVLFIIESWDTRGRPKEFTRIMEDETVDVKDREFVTLEIEPDHTMVRADPRRVQQ